MSEPKPVIQDIGDFLCFSVFDPITQKLLYSKYNFNFENYKTDKNLQTSDKNELFHNFLLENETDLWRPFSVKEELKKYFLPITLEIQDYFDDINFLPWDFNFNSRPTYVKFNTIMINEFNLYYYDYFDELANICEFLIRDDDNIIYSKYNFNFEEFSHDFNVYGSKISIFTNLLIRLIYLSDNAIGFIGFNKIPDLFKYYFYTDVTSQNSLEKYLEEFSVFSCFNNIERSPTKINYTHYTELIKTNYNIILNNEIEAKKYFLKYGQFQQDSIKFVISKDNEIMSLSRSICSVITSDSFGTGFLFRGDRLFDVRNGVQQVYLLTCYHLIEFASKNTIFATCYYDNQKDVKLQFRICGYDKHIDICICIYDDTLDYNKTFFPEEIWNIRNKLSLLDIYGDLSDYLGQQLVTIGNPGLLDNLSYMEGKMMDPKYSGTFKKKFILAYPTTILSDMHICKGQSGSPLFIRDQNDNILKCIGMINAKLGDDNQFCIGLNNNLLRRAISNGINYWFRLIRTYGLNNTEKISFNIQEIFPKKWLGVIFQYYNPINPDNNKSLSNFTVNGGIMITHFILGFNTIIQKFVYNYEELSQQGIIKLNTPLLQSEMYRKYIYNDRNPIIITSIKLYDLVNGIYKKSFLGKYYGQDGLDIFTYGFMQSGTVPNPPEYTNTVRRKYPPVIFDYFYYNGKNWVEATESVGANTQDWYQEYNDDYGHKFYQNKWEWPQILNAYLEPFVIESGTKLVDEENDYRAGRSDNAAGRSDNAAGRSDNAAGRRNDNAMSAINDDGNDEYY